MPTFYLSPYLKGGMTANAVLTSEGTLYLRTDKSKLAGVDFIFRVEDDGFNFSYSIQNFKLVGQRNNVVSVLTLEDVPDKVHLDLYIMWNHNTLTLLCKYGPNIADEKKAVVSTTPITPPISLIRWARKQSLIENITYNNAEAFRSKVLYCLESIQHKIDSSGGYYQFWNTYKEGQKIINRAPKDEIEIHPTIHCLLYDQSILSSFDVIPEFKTGTGNLDFLLMSKTKDMQTSKICVEFKNAHSDDLINGITNQLPSYMRNCVADYGIYCVLDYRGDWFSKPEFSNDKDIGVLLTSEELNTNDPIHENISLITLNLAKPKSASKK